MANISQSQEIIPIKQLITQSIKENNMIMDKRTIVQKGSEMCKRLKIIVKQISSLV